MAKSKKFNFKKNWLWFLILGVVILGILAIYLKTNSRAIKDKAELNRLQKDADPIAENILVSINKGDYEGFSKKFSEKMKNAATKKVFGEQEALIKEKIGKYVSKEFWKAERAGPYKVVYYKAKFEKETSDVIVKIVLQKIGDNLLIEGLWFDSPNLKQSN